MPLKRDIVVIGASAGGFEALRKIARELPRDFAAAVFFVLHVPASSGRTLVDILSREASLPAGQPGDGDAVLPGRIYVAAPDRHLVLEQRRVRLPRGPKQNRHRPAVDVLFRSAAFAHGARTIGVVLTGTLDDGAAGLAAIKRAGGLAVVQHPSDAEYPGMPSAALAATAVDYALPLDEIPELLARLTSNETPDSAAQSDNMSRFEVHADKGESTMEQLDGVGTRSPYTCPDCGGTLWELDEEDVLRYRCHVGHGYTLQTLNESQEQSLEDALWAGVRALEESAHLNRRMFARPGPRLARHAEQFRARAHVLDAHAARVRSLLAQMGDRTEQQTAVAGVTQGGEKP